jgi:hypothetical protein
MKIFEIFIFCLLLNYGESRPSLKPQEGFIWANATLWPNVTQLRSDTLFEQGKKRFHILIVTNQSNNLNHTVIFSTN